MAGLCSFNVSTRRLNREGLWANGKDQMSCNAKPVSVGFSHGYMVWWRKDCAMCLVVMPPRGAFACAQVQNRARRLGGVIMFNGISNRYDRARASGYLPVAYAYVRKNFALPSRGGWPEIRR
jgi:hypothetical protein